ncbi:MAG: hypothetical protein ACK4IS_12685 [Erythrobacter sp.]
MTQGHVTKAEARRGAAIGSLLLVAGCNARGAPAIEAFGAFFPAWLISALVGVIAAIGLRLVLALSGLDAVVPWLLAVCVSAGLIVAIAVSAWAFG